MPDERKKSFNIKIPAEAHEGWVRFVATHGGTVTSTVEAIGYYLAGLSVEDAKLPAHVQEWLRTSRRVAAERRPRGRPS